MGEDNEFQSRQERAERIRNIEYQVEEEKKISEERKQKERKKRDRIRREESKKEQARAEQIEKQRMATEKETLAKQQQQQEAREIMEQKRQAKNPDKTLDVRKTSSGGTIQAGSIASSTSNLAKENVTTEMYEDGNKVSERDLPQDLVRKIRKEQQKAIQETEDEINSATSSSQNLRGQPSSDMGGNVPPIINNPTNNYAGGGQSISSGIPSFSVDVKNGTPTRVMSGSYRASNVGRSSGNSGQNLSSESGHNTEDGNTNNKANDNNTSETTTSPNNSDLNNRDMLRASLAGLNSGSNTDGIINKGEKNNKSGSRNPKTSPTDNSGILGAGGMLAGIGDNATKNAGRTTSRVTGGQAQTISDGRDIDSEVSNRIVNNLGRASRTAGGATKKLSKAMVAAKKAMKAKKFLSIGAIIGLGGIFIVIVILVVGAISFIMNMPGMVRDKIANMWDTFWQETKGSVSELINGPQKATPTVVKNLAEYLESMGYDLVDNGFVTKLEKDKEGNIKEIESKYLAAYISAEERSYLIANENYSVKSIWDGVTGLFDGTSTMDDNWGTGMIVLERTTLENVLANLLPTSLIGSLVSLADSLADFFMGETNSRDTQVNDISTLTTRIFIKRDTKEMFISKVDIVDAFNTGGYDVYRYSLKEWTEKYGTPTELFLTLHLATRAPEFAYKWATTYDTKVFLDIKELTNVDVSLVYAKTDENNKIVLDENGKPEMIPISQMDDATIKSKGISQSALEEMRKINNTKITAFTPYITKVLNHWYYEQVIFQGEYNGKKIDVYEIRNLKEGDPGYVRYYAYTRRDNADKEKIGEDSGDLKPVGNSGLMGLINVAIKVMTTVFTGGFSGISGFMTSVSEAAMQEAYQMLSDAVVNEISAQVKDLLPNELAGMLNVKDFLKGNLSFDSLQELAETGINLDNMSTYLDFDKITSQINVDNLQLNAEKLWDELNLEEELMNMDIAGLGSVNDLEKVVNNIDLSNLDKVFDEQFDKFAEFSNTSFDKLTNELVKGFSSSIEEMQNSIVESCDTLFSGLSEEDFGIISDNLLDGVTKELTDGAIEPIVDKLDGSIEKLVEGKFNTQILSGLQNEFSKQLTGLPYSDLSQIASIPNMDFDQLKNVSGQVTGITSALTGAESSIANLSNQVNKLSRDITGMDTRVLNSVANSVTGLGDKIDTLTKETVATKNAVNSLNSSDPKVKGLLNKIDSLENKTKQLKTAGENLDLEEITKIQKEIDTYKSDINKITNTLDGIDDNTIGKIKTQTSKLENEVTGVVDHINSWDSTNLSNLKYRIPDLGQNDLIALANDFNNLDVANNKMKTLVKQYGSDLTNLRTSDINMIIDGINGQNVTTQQALNGISGYLMRSDETELANNLRTLNNSVKLVNDLTDDFDTDTIVKLVDKVPGFDSLHLNNIANQVKDLQNVSVDKLLEQVENLPEKLVDKVSSQLTEKIKQGVKDGISENLSQKLKSNLTGSGNFSSKLKDAMTSGPKEDIDVEAKDDAIEEPYSEYSTGFYVREIRTQDYFQKAEPVRVLYSSRHWIKTFREDKYIILDTPGIDMSRISDPEYVEQYGKTIWEATDGDVQTAIYAMLQGIQSADSQYLFRYFKELFNDVSWAFDSNFGFMPTIDPNAIKKDTIGWIFKTAKVKEPVFIGDASVHSTLNQKISVDDINKINEIAMNNMPDGASYYTEKHSDPEVEVIKTIDTQPLSNSIDADAYAKQNMPGNAIDYRVFEKDISSEYVDYDYRLVTVYYYGYKDGGTVDLEITYYAYKDSEIQEVEKAEYEPYTWAASKVGILNPKSLDPVYGFEPGLDIVSPVEGVIVAKTEARKNELGQQVSQSVTIELRNTGDENADGMRIILIGGDYSNVQVGSIVRKVEYTVDAEGKYTGEAAQSVIGKTTDEAIKIMVLDKDQTPVDDVSEYIYPPYQQYTPLKGGMPNGQNEDE